MSDQSIADLVDEWDRLIVSSTTHPDHTPVDPVRSSGSILRAGADAVAVAAAEQRLGVTLPDDYTAFLLHSDGAYADWGGVIAEEELFARSRMPEPGMGFLPIAHVAPMAEVDPWWTEMWVEGDQGREPVPPPEWSDVLDMRPLEHGLLITSVAEAFRMVLVPVADRWEVWDFYKDGATRHISFAAWLRFRIASLQPAVATEIELRTLLDRAAAGDQRARLDVLKVSAPQLEPVIVETLSDSARLGLVIAIVDRWPSDAVVGALDAALDAADGGDLASFGLRHEILTRLMLIGTADAQRVLRKHGAAARADMARRKRAATGDM